METTDFNWVQVTAYPLGLQGRPRHQLDSVILSAHPAGHAVMGPSDVALERERRLLLRSEPVPREVVFSARVWDHDRHFQWRGDLDLVARAAELQRVADLLATPVHVTEHFVGPLRGGRFKQLSKPRLVCTFHPQTATSGSPLAQLSKISANGRTRVGDAPVWWEARSPHREPACYMDFSPSARRAVANATLPDLHAAHPQMGGAVRELRRSIMEKVTRYGMCDMREPLMQQLIDRYVQHALADVLVELRQLGHWPQTP